MNRPAAVERHRDLVAVRMHVGGVPLEQQPRRQQGDPAHAGLAQQVAERPEVRVQQRLAAGKHHMGGAELAQRRQMREQALAGELALVAVRQPDVAHHAAAVTGTVRHEDHDGQRVDPVGRQREMTFDERDGPGHRRSSSSTKKRPQSRNGRRPRSGRSRRSSRETIAEGIRCTVCGGRRMPIP